MYKRVGCAVVLAALASSAGAQSFGSWEPGVDLPTNGQAKSHGIGLELNGTMFVLGGPPWINGTEDGSVYSFAPGASVWNEELGFDGLGFVLSQGGGVDDLGRIIIFGGDNPQDPGFDKLPFEWNPIEGPWHDHAARGILAPAMYFADCTDSFGRIYSIGGGLGEDATAGNPNSTYVERFIGSSDSWEQLAQLPIAAADAAAAPDGLGHILVFGGVSADGMARLSQVQQYDIATDTWSTIANTDMPVALSGHEATLGADGRVYILGGASGPVGAETIERAVWVYNPITNQWIAGPDMAQARRWFASFLGSDDKVYVIGGDNATGGSFGVEGIYTTPCPVFTQEPADVTAWRYARVAINTATIGGGTISYQWEKDGAELADGPTVGGGTASGTTTASLVIDEAGTLDAGSYQLVATNACGSTLSSVASVIINTPVDLPSYWTFTSLHPVGANHSLLTGVDGQTQVGTASFDEPDFGYLNLDHPYVWNGTASSAVNLTQSTSPGGSILDVEGDKLVGWWWAPVQCYVNHQWQTCYFRRAAWWNLDGTFHSTNYSGFEYTLMNATDGVSIVGSGADDFGSDAVIWQPPTFEFAQTIFPLVGNSVSFSAVDGEHQYGSVSFPFQGIKAGMWTGTRSSYVDMHPANAVNSRIADAADGQQVGEINIWNSPQGGIWTGTAESFYTLTPDSAVSCSVVACKDGLQVGSVDYDDGTGGHPVLWAGSKNVLVELSTALPSEYAGLAIAALDVNPDGSVSLAGSAWNVSLSRREAILLRSTTVPPCLADVNHDGTVSPADFTAWIAAFNAMAPECDQNGDGSCTAADFTAWIANFNSGC